MRTMLAVTVALVWLDYVLTYTGVVALGVAREVNPLVLAVAPMLGFAPSFAILKSLDTVLLVVAVTMLRRNVALTIMAVTSAFYVALAVWNLNVLVR